MALAMMRDAGAFRMAARAGFEMEAGIIWHLHVASPRRFRITPPPRHLASLRNMADEIWHVAFGRGHWADNIWQVANGHCIWRDFQACLLWQRHAAELPLHPTSELNVV